MPILTPEQIATLQTKVREAIMDANPDKALELLVEALPSGRAKHNQIVLLKSRQSEIVQRTVNNTLNEEQLEVMRNNLTADVLLFINHLTSSDFQPEQAQRPGLKPGHLLYQVPTMMVLQTTYDCLVRVAEELSQVMEGIASDEDVVVEDIGLSEVMEVEILDAGGTDNPAFNIMLLSDGEQVVDEYSYTEWVFNVRPLQEGQHQLILKISVLLTIKGKERTKNVVLRRPIIISAEAKESVPEARLRRLVATASEEVTISETPKITPPNRTAPPAQLPLETTTSDGTLLKGPGSHPIRPLPPMETEKSDEVSGGEQDSPPLPPPSPAPTPGEQVPKSSRSSWLSIAASILLLFAAGFWIAKSDGIENLLPGDKPSVGPTDPDTLVSTRDTTDVLLAPKSLVPDSLEND